MAISLSLPQFQLHPSTLTLDSEGFPNFNYDVVDVSWALDKVGYLGLNCTIGLIMTT